MHPKTIVPLVVAAGLLVAAPADGQDVAIPPDTVSTVFVSDTIEDFAAVGGVVVDALGYVYVADFRNTVWRIHPHGHVERFADGFYGASGNAIGPKGYLYQSSFYGNYVARVTRTGHWEVIADEGLSGPVGIAASPDGVLYVVNCSGNSVSKIDSEGKVSLFSESPLFVCPNGITFDDRGDLYVVNFSSSKIVRITPDGTATEFTDVPGGQGNGHITFARGAFYVTQFRGHRVFRVARDGTYAPIAGTGQAGADDGPALEATMTRPNGIGVSPNGKELWVNDFTEGVGLGQGVSVVTMRRIRLVTASDVLGGLDPAGGVERVRAVYEAYHDARPDEDTVAELTQLGFQWMQSPNWQSGVALFEMSAERFPEHVTAQFNLGEAYRFTNQLQKAASQYRRVLELQPDHPVAGQRLEQVGGN